MGKRTFYVYILASRSRVLYIGVTGNLLQRLDTHRSGRNDSFTTRYRIRSLVYCEPYTDVRDALAREKQLKGWRRDRKVALIEAANPQWHDLADEWLV